MRMAWPKAVACGLAGSAALMLGMGAQAQTVTAVPKLDLTRFDGVWYEIARLPDKAQKKCVGDVMVLYSQADKANQFQVVNSCKVQHGVEQIRNGNGKLTDKSGAGKVKVTYVWPFSTKYWVLATGTNLEWVLLGSPNHKTMWILSKTRVMPAETLSDIEGKAASQGFDTAKLIRSNSPG